MKRYNLILDIYKLIACYIIMKYHSFLIGASEPYLFQMGYLFTDLFFILTGYYTTKYISENNVSMMENAEDNRYGMAYIYLKRKFQKIMPYVIISTLICAAITYYPHHNEGVIKWLWYYSNIPMEISLLSQFYESYPLVNSMWYLSSLVFALPIVYIFFFKMNDYKRLFLAIILFGLYEGAFINFELGSFGGVLRALCIMCGGTISFHISQCLNKKSINTLKLVLLRLFCFGGMGLIVLWNMNNIGVGVIYNFYFIFFVGVAACDQVAYTKLFGRYKKPVIGKLTTVMYIMHWTIAVLLMQFRAFVSLSLKCREQIWLGGTIIFSLLMMNIISNLERKWHHMLIP